MSDAQTQTRADTETQQWTLYDVATRAPRQAVPLKLAGAVRTVELKPGRTVELPDGHRVTEAWIAAGYVTAPAADAADDPADDPAATRRATIAAAIADLTEAERNLDGSPRVAAVSERLGAPVTAAEIRAAMEDTHG